MQKVTYRIKGVEVSEDDFDQYHDTAYKKWKERMKREKPRSIFPCRNCISFAICNARPTLLCSLLDKWMWVGIYYRGKPNAKKRYRVKLLEEKFKRRVIHYQQVYNTSTPELEVRFSNRMLS